MASKAKTATNGVETIEAAVKTGAEAFKDGFEKAAKGYEQIVSFNKDTAEAVLKSANIAGKGIETLNTEVFNFSRQSVEDSVAVTKAVLASKTIQEVIEIQSDYAKSAFETYVAELNKVRELTLELVKTATAPLQARAVVVAGVLQARAI